MFAFKAQTLSVRYAMSSCHPLSYHSNSWDGIYCSWLQLCMDCGWLSELQRAALFWVWHEGAALGLSMFFLSGLSMVFPLCGPEHVCKARKDTNPAAQVNNLPEFESDCSNAMPGQWKYNECLWEQGANRKPTTTGGYSKCQQLQTACFFADSRTTDELSEMISDMLDIEIWQSTWQCLLLTTWTQHQMSCTNWLRILLRMATQFEPIWSLSKIMIATIPYSASNMTAHKQHPPQNVYSY